jgi:WD40 repeat protein
VYALAWAPEGIRLALGTKHGDIQLWNTRSKTLLLTAKQRFGEVYALAWSPDGKYLASGGQDQTVHLWNTTTGQQAFTIAVAKARVKCERSPGRLMAVFSNFSGEDEMTALAWSPDRLTSACLLQSSG